MYEARITRQSPTAFIFLLDQSGSMDEKACMGSRNTSKAIAVANVTNSILIELVRRCMRDDGIRDYFDIAVIGYNTDSIKNLLTKDNTFVKPSQLAAMNVPMVKTVDERVLPNGDISRTNNIHPAWIQPESKGSTPMYAALLHAYRMAKGWCTKFENRNSYPLTIFNITDGEGNDSSPAKLIEIASMIKSLSTGDGNALLINIHISATECHNESAFPSNISQLPNNKSAQTLFEMSSIMPESYNDKISSIDKYHTEPPFRGICFNSSVRDLLSMINIGSVSINLIQ